MLPARCFGFFFKEEEVEEKFQRGFGPGGQAVNKSQNCVLLRHKPSGIVVRCFEDRMLEVNRKVARERLDQRLDVYYNGDQSAVIQAKKLRRKMAMKTRNRFLQKVQLQKTISSLKETCSSWEEFQKAKTEVLENYHKKIEEEEEASREEKEQEYRNRCKETAKEKSSRELVKEKAKLFDNFYKWRIREDETEKLEKEFTNDENVNKS